MMAPANSIWTYPWDLHDIGLDAALERTSQAGLNTISLATSYHAGRFLQPGNPRRRVYFPEDGTVYFRSDPAKWSDHEITPKQAAIVDTEGDMLDALVRRRDAGGAAVSCWTVCLHNTRLGLMHPGHVMRTAHGDPMSYALCPSSPAARAYVTGLVSEISHAYRPDRIELESPDFMGFPHGFHHEKDGLPLQPDESFLLGVCFCDYCRSTARAAGLPADIAQSQVARLLDNAFSRELPRSQFPDFPSNGPESFEAHSALSAYLAWRSEPVTSLIAEIREATHPDTKVLLIDAEGTWTGGIDLPNLLPHLDGVLHCAYETEPARISPLLAQTRALLGSDKTLIAGFQLFNPTVRDQTDLENRVAQALPHVDGLNFYNLGLVPQARLGWIAAALHK
ncbi:hypothetical protein [Sedimentitalea todarodis]|uniref:Uncharacterized protein n=1 Tax=Sedimentitalea todarodis TaxID=1631240 RepID=A0ABU3VJL7_9RHOB|nr:hypothetical protein [Sedimentitalea todarodis]MDU9006350.1 hypothetical protein [Sedimentitalea todarodis]